MTAPQINASLIGQTDGRKRLETPALVIDLDVLERNLTLMAEYARSRSIGLRPHAKTHKSAEIARRQVAAGALGICVAKLGEAEVLAQRGIHSLHLTSPVVSENGIRRLVALNEVCNDLMTVCDDISVAARLAEAAKASGKALKILVDLDPGLGRTGTVLGPPGLELVELVSGQAGLNFGGLQCYAGDLQHIGQRGERRTRSLAVLRKLTEFLGQLNSRGIKPQIVSGGGTGTFDIDPDARTLTELQVGSYVFMDREYNDVWGQPGEQPPFETSLFVQTTVISVDHGGSVTTDAGLKAFATDAGPPRIASGAPPDASYNFFGDEQGRITFADRGGEGRVKPGHVVACVVPHCDPTVNLYDWYHVVRGDVLEAIWPVDTRGCSA